MNKRLVLVDSSVWVSYFLGQFPARSEILEDLLEKHGVAINPIIRVELLTGALNDDQYVELEESLQGLHALPLSPAVWRQAERLRYQLRRAGHLIPLTDVLIACSAILYNCELFHLDRHFEIISRSAPLRIFRPDR